MKICILSDNLSEPYDEGFKKLSFNISKELSIFYDTLVISRQGSVKSFKFRKINYNILLLDKSLKSVFSDFKPNIIIYIPFSSMTFNSFLRCFFLKIMSPDSQVILIGVQQRNWNYLSGKIIGNFKQIKVLTPVLKNLKQLKKLNISSDFLPFGVNLNKFKPPKSQARKKELRKKYGLDEKKKIFLHVGQITIKRNVHILTHLQKSNSQVLIVGSSSSESLNYPHNSTLVNYLENKGVKVIIDFLPEIEELYQLSDCYIFPTFNEKGGIGFPLSVIEALACGLKVVTTPYGGLSFKFKDSESIKFAKTNQEIISLSLKQDYADPSDSRKLAKPYLWENIAKKIIEST